MLLPTILHTPPLPCSLCPCFVRALSVTLPRLPHSCNIPLSHSDLTTTSTSPSRHIPDEVYLSLQLCLFYWRYKELALARGKCHYNTRIDYIPGPQHVSHSNTLVPHNLQQVLISFTLHNSAAATILILSLFLPPIRSRISCPIQNSVFAFPPNSNYQFDIVCLKPLLIIPTLTTNS